MPTLRWAETSRARPQKHRAGPGRTGGQGRTTRTDRRRRDEPVKRTEGSATAADTTASAPPPPPSDYRWVARLGDPLHSCDPLLVVHWRPAAAAPAEPQCQQRSPPIRRQRAPRSRPRRPASRRDERRTSAEHRSEESSTAAVAPSPAGDLRRRAGGWGDRPLPRPPPVSLLVPPSSGAISGRDLGRRSSESMSHGATSATIDVDGAARAAPRGATRPPLSLRHGLNPGSCRTAIAPTGG